VMKWQEIVYRLSIALAVAVAAVLPAYAQGDGTTATATPAAAEQSTAFHLPSVTPMGQGWYGAASTTTENAMMAQGDPWSNDLVPVRALARLAIIDGDPAPTMTATTASRGPDRLVTGVAQWMNPSDNSLYEIRFTGIDTTGPLDGAGVFRVIHGETGIGTDRFPRTLAYAALFGPVQVFRNGQMIASNLQGQMMVTQGIRTPDTGRLLDTANVRAGDLQLHLIVQGQIPGRNQDMLYLFWPSATVDIRNLGTPVALLPQEIQTARGYFTEGAVAGYREPATPGAAPPAAPRLLISLRDRFLARSTPELSAGDAELSITNDSSVARGFFIQGPGVEQRTRLLNPGESTTLTIRLSPGTYRLASFTVATPEADDYMHMDTITVR
jgi:hypothetical protein